MKTQSLLLVILLAGCCGGAAFTQPARVAASPDTLDIEIAAAKESVSIDIKLVDRNGETAAATRDIVLDLSLTRSIGRLQDEKGKPVTQVTVKRGEGSARVYFAPDQPGTTSLLITPRDRILFGTKVLIVLY